jgi:hypothetical protein
MRLIAGQHIAWREQLDVNDVDAQCDEYGWDEMFAELDGDVAGGNTASAPSSVRRMTVAPGSFQRQSSPTVKKAAATNWDNEFSNAQAHAREVLAKLGHG